MNELTEVFICENCPAESLNEKDFKRCPKCNNSLCEKCFNEKRGCIYCKNEKRDNEHIKASANNYYGTLEGFEEYKARCLRNEE